MKHSSTDKWASAIGDTRLRITKDSDDNLFRLGIYDAVDSRSVFWLAAPNLQDFEKIAKEILELSSAARKK